MDSNSANRSQRGDGASLSEFLRQVSESYLQRVNLTDGKAVDVVARFNTDRLQGFDWHETQQ